MRLSDALQINRRPNSPHGRLRRIHLVCGFTPLHLETVLTAQAKLRLPGDGVEVMTGLFGDLEGNIQRASEKAAEGAAIVIEWSDLDSRLGLRSSAGWSATALADVLQQVAERLRRFTVGIAGLAKNMPAAVIPPALPLPPLTHFPVSQASP